MSIGHESRDPRCHHDDGDECCPVCEPPDDEGDECYSVCEPLDDAGKPGFAGSPARGWTTALDKAGSEAFIRRMMSESDHLESLRVEAQAKWKESGDGYYEGAADAYDRAGQIVESLLRETMSDPLDDGKPGFAGPPYCACGLFWPTPEHEASCSGEDE